jgi:BASS family bile acid:Na+ symporter
MDTSHINEAVITLEPTTQIALAVSLAFTMFTVALGLKTNDFSFLRAHPRSILFGFLAQVLGLPLMTLGLLMVFEPMAGVALGMLIVSCCPGGNVSNLFTRLSRGNVAYSVPLTTCSSIFSAAFLPVAILFWTGLYGPTRALVETIHLDRAGFILSTGLTLLVPLAAGILVSHYRPALAAALQRLCLPVAVLVIAMVIGVGLSGNAGLLRDFGHVILPYVVLHNAAAFALGGIIGLLALRTGAARRALIFEIGIQNSGLGLLIMLSQFGGLGSGAMVIATWGIWHFIGGFALTGLFRLARKRRPSHSLELQEDSYGL